MAREENGYKDSSIEEYAWSNRGLRKRKYRTYLCDKFQVDMMKIEAVVNILVVAEE